MNPHTQESFLIFIKKYSIIYIEGDKSEKEYLSLYFP